MIVYWERERETFDYYPTATKPVIILYETYEDYSISYNILFLRALKQDRH